MKNDNKPILTLAILIILLLLSLFFINCSFKSEAAQDLDIKNEIKIDDLIHVFIKSNIVPTNLFLSDSKIICPTKSWIEDTYMPGLRTFFFDNGINNDSYKVSSFDCDDFSLMAKTYGSILYYKTKERPPYSSLGEFEFWYSKNNKQPHAIVGFVCRTDKGFELVFVEPQAGVKIVNLSREEMASNRLIKF